MTNNSRFRIIAGKINEIPEFYALFARKMSDWIIDIRQRDRGQAEAKCLRLRPMPKFCPRGHFGLEDLTSLLYGSHDFIFCFCRHYSFYMLVFLNIWWCWNGLIKKQLTHPSPLHLSRSSCLTWHHNCNQSLHSVLMFQMVFLQYMLLCYFYRMCCSI